jgi:hypothetical protein
MALRLMRVVDPPRVSRSTNRLAGVPSVGAPAPAGRTRRMERSTPGHPAAFSSDAGRNGESRRMRLDAIVFVVARWSRTLAMDDDA